MHPMPFERTRYEQGVDLAWLRRRAMLTPGRSSIIAWSRAGQQTGSLSPRTKACAFGTGQSVTTANRLTSTSSSLSPTRPQGSAAGGNGYVARGAAGNAVRSTGANKKSEGQAFIDWVLSPEGQNAIKSFQINGEQQFFPNADPGQMKKAG